MYILLPPLHKTNEQAIIKQYQWITLQGQLGVDKSCQYLLGDRYDKAGWNNVSKSTDVNNEMNNG